MKFILWKDLPGFIVQIAHSILFPLQVVVTINDIVSACINNSCSYKYSDAQTPKITSVSPTSGHGGPPGTCTVITIAGSGFGITNTVTISGTPCTIQSSNSSSITCCVGELNFLMVKFQSSFDNGKPAYKYKGPVINNAG